MSNNFKAIAIDANNVRVQFDESADIAGLEVVLINKLREPVLRQKVVAHSMTLQGETAYPMFVQVGTTVKYVEGSGHSEYCEI